MKVKNNSNYYHYITAVEWHPHKHNDNECTICSAYTPSVLGNHYPKSKFQYKQILQASNRFPFTLQSKNVFTQFPGGYSTFILVYVCGAKGQKLGLENGLPPKFGS